MRAGVAYALVAALLFGASTPVAKVLLGALAGPAPAQMLAGLLYLGSGVTLAIVHIARRARGHVAAPIAPGERKWLTGAVLFGGVLAPVLLLTGLARTTAASASLLLNLEGVFTALLAWTIGKENVDRRIALGMLAIVVGGVVLAWHGSEAVDAAAVGIAPVGHTPSFGALAIGPLAICAACFAWGVDNTLTQRVAAADAVFTAAVKGLAAGVVNVALALALGASLPALAVAIGAMALGAVAYGASLVCFIVALRHLGSARTGAYFAVAPFVGALASFALLRDALTWQVGVAGALMGVGVLIHIRERHEHEHHHEALTHSHAHTPDIHHRHSHRH